MTFPVLDSGNFPRIQPITKDDIRFVTAVQYWEGKVGNTIDPNDIDNYSGSNPTAVGEDNKWVQKAPTVEPNYQPGATVEEREKARLEAEQQTLNNRAYRAEHYNYRWTNEQTRTYRIGSIAEVSERLYKIHQSDGTLKEGVVWHKHINLTSEDRNGLKGSLIPVDSPEQNIALPLGGKIVSYESIKQGLLAVATAMFKQDEKADGIDSKIDNHIQQTNVHGATSSPEANRIAIRDKDGRFEVEDPVTDKQVVNINYLNNTFRIDVLLKLLMTKYITNQQEFNNWLYQTGNKAYTHVILEGSFSYNHTIKLKTIGTKEVISRGAVNITVYISSNDSGVEAGIDGDGEASVSGVNLTVKGRCTQSNRVIGFEQCKCTGCKAVVVGADGENSPYNDLNTSGYFERVFHDTPTDLNGGNGASAVGFWQCRVDNCEADIQGGHGGYGSKFRYDTNSWTYHYSTYYGVDGGRGGDGGYATSFYECTFISNPRYERVVGGNGGEGGNGGHLWTTKSDKCYFDWKYRSGNGGNGGNATGKSGLQAGEGGAPGSYLIRSCGTPSWSSLGGIYASYGDDGTVHYI